MVFSSAVFLWLFLPIVFLINLIIPKKCSNIFLLIASLFFYAWGEPIYVFLMIGTIIINYFIGRGIEELPKYKKLILTVGIIGDLAVLGYYKYANFFVGIVNDVIGKEIITSPNVILPIGISFFTFQAMSYIIDVYRKDTEASKSIINVALYIAYFPQLIAGPVVKYKEINKQIEERYITSEGVALGFKRFIYGLGKKVIIANILGKACDIVFDLNMTEIGIGTAWFGALMYTFQMYYDFSGYSDMAIGLGKMFGFDIPENFRHPYIAGTYTEYWKRWHLSISTWFREYVYFPLGGSRKGKVRSYINIAIVFALTGFWHGASFSYIGWGVINVFFIIIERMFLLKKLKNHAIISRIYFWLTFLPGVVIFRVNNLRRSFAWIGKMYSFRGIGQTEYAIGNYMNGTTWAVLIMAIAGCGFVQVYAPQKIKDKWTNSPVELVFCGIVLLLSMSLIASSTYNPFIYFQF